MTDEDCAGGSEAGAQALLGIIREMASELHPQRQHLQLTLSSDLDRDLGFDSLARVELLRRINDAFRVDLGETVLASAETPADLLAVLTGASSRGHSAARPLHRTLEAAVSPPAAATTLLEVLAWHAAEHADRPHVRLLEADGSTSSISYGDLRACAARVAAGIRELSLSAGSQVAIMLPTSEDYLYCFLGVLMAGGVPVPIYPPARASQLEEHLRRHAAILNNAGTPLLITVEHAQPLARLLEARVPDLTHVVTVAQLTRRGTEGAPAEVRGSDVAFLQYTSGSTGDPKGVVLTHGNLLANIRAMGQATNAGSRDVFVSWLPLYHDMGLIGAWLGSLYYGIPLVLMSPVTFLTGPVRWLRAIHEHGGTLTAAPNFGYELCLKRLDPAQLHGLDLSTLRLAFNGAEPVSPSTLRDFTRRFAGAGLRAEALAPVYGLAEAAVGVAFPPLGRPPRIDRVDRQRFLRTGIAEPASSGAEHVMEFVGCGRPLPGYALRVVEAAGRELPERVQGRLEFVGPSATSGYFRNPEATDRLFDHGWLDTGDLAYLADGEVFVTGRVKDTIIRAGRNLYPFELEDAVGRLPGVRTGCVAVIGARDTKRATERVVVVAETRTTDPGAREALIRDINGVASDVLGDPPDDVVLVPPHSVLKTSSGKIRRSAVRALYESGSLGRAAAHPIMQIVRLAASGSALRVQRGSRWLVSLAYAAWVHALFWTLAPLVWLLLALTPGMRLRWRIARTAARLLLRLGGAGPTVAGPQHLQQIGPCIVVCNHTSYLDGVVTMAVLPFPVRFIAKAELATQCIAGTFLRRIGATFVDRFDVRSGAQDAHRASMLLERGDRLLYFPEGTFFEEPGLRPFRSGAFVAAAEWGAKVVPVVIEGTRAVLPGSSHRPRHHAIHVEVMPPLQATGNDWEAAMRLRGETRQSMLGVLHEPDLS